MSDLDSVLDDIRFRLDIPAVYGRYVQKLKKSGRNYMGLCPFHNEKTASFSIDPERGLYNCFGCGVRGSIFQFLQQQTGQHFLDVVRGLAEETGTKMPERNESSQQRARREKREKIVALNTKTQHFFRNCLRGDPGRPAQAYLDSRGVTPEVAERFGIGFGGSDPQAFLRFLEREGASHDDAAHAGVLKINDRGPYPFFSGRVTFPIKNARGHIVSFSARALGDRKPKYVNGPATDAFDKSRELFGLFEALKELKRGRPAVLVEGQLDVIACHQAGASSAVAPCGTSLTERHVEVLKRHTERIVLCLDDDEAGRKAAERSALLLLRAGLDVSLVQLEGGDPDDLVRAGEGEKLRTAIEGAPGAVEVFIERARQRAGANVRARTKAIDHLLPFLAAPPRELIRRALVRAAAKALGEEEDVLLGELERGAKRPAPKPPQPRPQEREAPRPTAAARTVWRPAERLLAKALLAHPLLVPRCGVLTEGLRNPELRSFIERLADALVVHHELPPHEVLKAVPLARGSEVFELVAEMFQAGGFEDPERFFPFTNAAQVLDDFLLNHDKRPISVRLLEIQRALEAAEEADDGDARHRLQRQHRALNERRRSGHELTPSPAPVPVGELLPELPPEPLPVVAASAPADGPDAWDAQDDF